MPATAAQPAPVANRRVECPQCHARYAITPAKLQAGLRVKCSKCGEVFATAEHVFPPLPPVLDEQVVHDDEGAVAARKKKRTSTGSVHRTQSSGATRQTVAGVAVSLLMALVLTAALVGQYAWYMQRDWVLQHPTLRPWLESACQLAQCALPVTRNPSEFSVEKSFLEAHSQTPDAVLMHFTFSNRGSYPQPYPWLEVSFADENEREVGVRRFAPAEYLGRANVAQELMPPGGQAHVKLEMQNVIEAMHSAAFHIHFL